MIKPSLSDVAKLVLLCSLLTIFMRHAAASPIERVLKAGLVRMTATQIGLLAEGIGMYAVVEDCYLLYYWCKKPNF